MTALILLPLLLHAQTISGRITDEKGEPLSGGNVLILGTNTGTAANQDGYFSLNLRPGTISLRFSFIGYVSDTLTVTVQSGQKLQNDVRLRQSTLQMDMIEVFPTRYNSAEEVVLNAIREKQIYLSALHNYEYAAYSQTSFIPLRKDSVETIGGIAEIQSRGYFQAPNSFQEIVLARRRTANFSEVFNIFSTAERLNLDILPLLIHGAADTIKRGEFWVRSGRLTVKVLDRIAPDDPAFGVGYSARTKFLCESMRSQYSALRGEKETPEYFRSTLLMNYRYKGTFLEWNLRKRLRREQNFMAIDELIPKNALVTDLGCGHGFLSMMLSFTSPGRIITGIDRDARRVALADNCFSKTPRLKYLCEDFTHCTLPESDVFILLDVLQHVPQSEQQRLIGRCKEALSDSGIIIVRNTGHAVEVMRKT
ncbi:MAG: carboxypeptidase-like regulatory domain-containing protein [Bacteroidota bacterium]